MVNSRIQAYWSSNAAASINADSIFLEGQLGILTTRYNYYIGMMTDYKENIQLYREKVAYDMDMVSKYVSAKNYIMVTRYYYTMFIPHYYQFRAYIIKYMTYLRSSNQGDAYQGYSKLLGSMGGTYRQIQMASKNRYKYSWIITWTVTYRSSVTTYMSTTQQTIDKETVKAEDIAQKIIDMC